MKYIILISLIVSAITGFAQTLSTINNTDVRENGHYGWDLAVDDSWLAVSAPHTNTTHGSDAGRVDIFKYKDNEWVLMQELIPNTGESFENFGYAIDMKDDILVIGALGSFSNGPFSGCAYVYELIDSVWTYKATLHADDAHNAMHFGNDVATNGNTIVVGAILADGVDTTTGAAYVFTKTSDIWSQSQKLTDPNGATSDRFGCSVSINNNNTIVVGAYHNSTQAEKAGAAFVFEGDGSSWSLTDTLLAPTYTENDMFGYSTDICNNEIVISAFHADGTEENSGVVYVFNKEQSDWVHQYDLTPSDGERNDLFGVSLSLSENRLLVGTPRKDNVDINDQGAVYLYERSSDIFDTETIITETETAAYNNFGLSVAIDSTQLFVSSRFNDSEQTNGGAVYYSGEPDDVGFKEELSVIYKTTNYPNPATEFVTIDYYLPFEADVKIDIYSINGELVSRLHQDNEQTGKHKVDWDCKSDDGSRVSPGTYIYKLSINGNIFSNKITVSEK